MARLREPTIFVNESGDFAPLEEHAPFYVIGLVLHDQGDDITAQLERIHESLSDRGFRATHAIHTGPLIRREANRLWMPMSERRAIFDFVRVCEVSHHSWAFSNREIGGGDQLVSTMARELGPTAEVQDGQ